MIETVEAAHGPVPYTDCRSLHCTLPLDNACRPSNTAGMTLRSWSQLWLLLVTVYSSVTLHLRRPCLEALEWYATTGPAPARVCTATISMYIRNQVHFRADAAAARYGAVCC